MKLFGHPLSPCTRKVKMTLAEKGAQADFSLVDLPAGEHKTTQHRQRHPFAFIPVLEDDGFVLYESRAIIRHLDRTLPGPSLVPAAPRDVARMDQWLSVDQAYVAPSTRVLAVERFVKRHHGEAEDRAATAEAETQLRQALAVIDRALGESPYLAGLALSLADVSLAPYVASLPLLGAEHLMADVPRLSAWWSSIRARPSWEATVAA
ncbi:MAG TPA: glutathione S-transferase family protein [Polyangiaceae bacterium]|jgi:glutathione S-transferase|nr:glutathione S-transferase family protein [Polyangiaceae bacterium]